MTAEIILTLVLAAVLTGMKTAYGKEWFSDSEQPFYRVWLNRSLYPWSMIWIAVYLAIWYCFGRSAQTVRVADLIVSYLILAIVDAKRKIVPDPILVCFFCSQMILGTVTMIPSEIWHFFWTGCIFSAAVFVLTAISGGRAGTGDALLLAVTAVTAGWGYTMQILMVGLFLSFLFGIMLMLLRKASIKTEIPFVPFLAAGILIHTMLWIL